MEQADGVSAPPAAIPSAPRGRGRGVWAEALRWLAGDISSIASALVLVLVLLSALLAPLYAGRVAQSDPFRSQLDAIVTIDGEPVDVLQPSTEGLGLGVTPIGPTWRIGPYVLGADAQGRDLMSRVLYGGRSTLLIAGLATVITLVLAAIIGVTAGFFGGWVDWVLSHLLDVLWAFPIYLFAISLAIVLLTAHIEIGPFVIESGSLALPILIVGIVYVPYVARPIRGQVLALRKVEFVTAAVGLGIPAHRILIADILPNVATTLIVFAPLMMALNIGTESALSFLSLGVQPPSASWGTIMRDGQNLIYTRPWVSIAPGIAVIATIAALNILGDGVRRALDPRAKLRG